MSVRFYTNSLTSVTLPVMAAAAALKGLAKKVLDFGPCLPSKFRLEVLMQYFACGNFVLVHSQTG